MNPNVNATFPGPPGTSYSRKHDVILLAGLGLGRARQARWGLAGLGPACRGLARLSGA